MTVEVLSIKFVAASRLSTVRIFRRTSRSKGSACVKARRGINPPGCPALRWWPQRNPAKARNQPVKLLSQRRMQVQALDSGLIVIGVRLTVQLRHGRR